VHRLVAEGTVEDRVAELLEAKRGLADAIVGRGEAWIGELGDAELAELVTLTGDGTRAGVAGPVGRYLVEPDGAVIRAGLVAEAADLVDGRLLDPTIAYLTCDQRPSTPFGTAYEVTDVLPFGLKRLRTLLRERGVGRLTVKKRGTAVQPEALRKQLRLSGDAEATVVLTRIAGQQSVLVVERLPTGPLS
jgi:hypothetical protein